MERKTLIGSIVMGFLLVLGIIFVAQEAMADSRFYMVDGDDAGNAITVSFLNSTGYPFDILSGSSSFDPIAAAGSSGNRTFTEGQAPNFALKLGESNYLSLVTNGAIVTYVGTPIDSQYSQNPQLNTDYWPGAWIDWNITFPGVVVGVITSHSHDGFYPVPIPTTLLLLALGLLALVGLKRKGAYS